MRYPILSDDIVKNGQVCILRLTQEQYERLAVQKSVYRTVINQYNIADVQNTVNTLTNLLGNIQFFTGENFLLKKVENIKY